jgi:hypothetical protein
MKANDLPKDPTSIKILEAFTGPDETWRTIGGVSRETGVPVEEVQQFVQRHPDLFVESTLTPSGSPLIGLKEDIRQKFLKSF